MNTRVGKKSNHDNPWRRKGPSKQGEQESTHIWTNLAKWAKGSADVGLWPQDVHLGIHIDSLTVHPQKGKQTLALCLRTQRGENTVHFRKPSDECKPSKNQHIVACSSLMVNQSGLIVLVKQYIPGAGCSSVVQYLSIMCEALNSFPAASQQRTVCIYKKQNKTGNLSPPAANTKKSAHIVNRGATGT